MKCPYTGADCGCRKLCRLDAKRWEALALNWVAEDARLKRKRRLVTREVPS